MNKKRILKFLISGGTAACIEYGTFCLLLFLDVYIVTANIISFSLGFIVSFLLNKLWVFKAKGYGRTQLIMNGTLALINITITSVLLKLLTQLGTNPLATKFCLMGMVALWNYLIFSKFIFRER